MNSEKEQTRRDTDSAWVTFLKRPNQWVRVNRSPRYTKKFTNFPVAIPSMLYDCVSYSSWKDGEKEIRNRLLFRIWTSRVSLESQEITKALESAFQDRDWEFFNGLQEVIEQEKLDYKKLLELKLSIRDAFLLSGWDTPRGVLRALCHYSDLELEKLFQKHFKRTESAEAIKQARYRLGLPKK